MIVDFRTGEKPAVEPLVIKNENVDIVHNYTYLGSVMNDKLKVTDNVCKLYKKSNQRLYFLRKLKNVHVDTCILTMFYRSIIESVLTFCVTYWYGLATVQDKNKLNKIVKCARKLGCLNVNDIDTMYRCLIVEKMSKIMKSEVHPLNKYFKMLPSQKRISSVYARTSRFSNTFVPSAIRQFNGHD